MMKRTLLITSVKAIFIVSILIPQFVFAQSNNVYLKKMGALQGVTLKKGYQYGHLTANNHYLTWLELNDNIVYVYDLKQNKLIRTFSLKKGRGPHEYIEVYWTALTRNDNLYLLDSDQRRLIVYNLDSLHYKNDILLPFHQTPTRIWPWRNKLLITTTIAPDSPLLLFDPQTMKYTTFTSSRLNFKKEFNNNPFLRLGTCTVSGDKALILTRYRPYIYMYDIKNNSYVGKIKFEKSEITSFHNSVVHTNSSTIKRQLSPKRVNIMDSEIISIPGSPNRILIACYGNGENHRYHQDYLYEYDLKEKKMIGSFRLNAPIATLGLTENQHSLFFLSIPKDKVISNKGTRPTIYKYNILIK